MGQSARAGESAQRQRLDSWKAIAGFFDRDVRTVKRWEQDRALPVHRVPGGERGTVFAYSDELSKWLNQGPGSEVLNDTADPENIVVPPSTTPVSRAKPSPALRDDWELPIFAIGILLVAIAIGVIRDFHPWSFSAKGHVVHVPNAEAQDLYLKGRYYWNLRTADSLNQAVDLFTQSIVNDPQYAQAYAGLADCYLLLREFSQMPEDQAFPRALAAAHKAVELDDSASEAHRSLALALCYWSWDMTAAEREFRRALQLNPNDAEAHHWFATSLLVHGRYDEALQQIDAARKLQPSSISILADRALILSYAGRQAEAAAALHQIEATEPAFLSTHTYLASVYLTQRNYPLFLDELAKVAEISHDRNLAKTIVIAKQDLQRSGPTAMLRTVAQSYAANTNTAAGGQQAYAAAGLFAFAKDRTRTLNELDVSYSRHESGFLAIRSNPAFAFLQQDPHFKKLLAQSDVSTRTP